MDSGDSMGSAGNRLRGRLGGATTGHGHHLQLLQESLALGFGQIRQHIGLEPDRQIPDLPVLLVPRRQEANAIAGRERMRITATWIEMRLALNSLPWAFAVLSAGWGAAAVAAAE